jgi:uncharacterized ion transporter superfamily protein YfcC
MFSGAWMRALSFIFIYALLILFIRDHAKKIDSWRMISEDTDIAAAGSGSESLLKAPDPLLAKGLKLFAAIIGVGIVLVLSSAFLTFLQDYTMIIVALAFLAAGIFGAAASGMGVREMLRCFNRGVLGILPAVLMILMAASIKFTLTESGVIDMMLSWAAGTARGLPKWAVILFIYLIVLVMNFFIASGSAKAIMLIPLIVPIAQAFGISPQLCILAFAFGDGFSNVFYPTNAALLISLGLADISYTKWAKHSWKFQLANLALTCALLLFGLAVGY